MARGKGDRNSRLNGQRRDYLRYLGQIRRQVRRAAGAQREALEWTSPDPRALTALGGGGQPSCAGSGNAARRTPTSATIRLGTGTQQLAVRLVPPQTKPVEDLDPLCAGALRRFIRAHAQVPGLPVGISLRVVQPGLRRRRARAPSAAWSAR